MREVAWRLFEIDLEKMTEHKIGFENILGDVSGSSEADLKYPTQEVQKELERAEQEIMVDGKLGTNVFGYNCLVI